MGVYSLNRTNLNTIAQVEAEPYSGFVGCYEAMIDMEHNNHVIFEALIQNDFKEAAYVNEGNLEEAQIVNEASLAGIKEGIKKFLKKVWAKIMGILDSFRAKIDKVIMRDNVAYVKKYEKEVRKKDLSKMKYKFSIPKAGFGTLASSIEQPDQLKSIASGAISIIGTSSKESQSKFQEKQDKDFILKAVLKTDEVKMKSFDKDLHEFCFEKQEEKTGLSGDTLRLLIGVLSDKEMQVGKVKTSIGKIQNATNKYFQGLISELDKATKAAGKLDPDDKGSWDYEYDEDKTGRKASTNMTKGQASREYAQRASASQQVITRVEEVHNRLVTGFLKEYKFNMSQCRSVFSKAVSYKPKKSANASFEFEDEYLNAVAEAAEYDMEIMFESEVMVTEE